MALRFMDSFDHIGSAGQLLYKWSSYGGNSPFWGSYGRFGTNGIKSGDNNTYWLKILDAQPTWIIGFAGQPGSVGSNTPFAHIADGGTEQCYLYALNTGLVQLRRGDGTVLATGTKVLTAGVYYHFEWKLTIDNTTGASELRINGATDHSVSGIDTQNSANATADRFWLGENPVAAYMGWAFDDVHVCDGTGSAPYNNFLGECRVECLFPNGNGNSSQLVGSDANSTDNYLLVDETAPNGDTDYVESSTVGNKDTYTYGNLTPTTGTVYAVQINPYAEKTDAGTRTIATIARVSATEVDSSDLTLGATYGGQSEIRTTKPGGGSWSISDVNNAEFGVKVTA